MQNFAITLNWYKNKHVFLDKGIFHAYIEEDFVDYNPVAYMRTPLDQNIVFNILGDDNIKTTHYLLTLFLSMDIENKSHLLGWIKNFGFLNHNSLTEINPVLKQELKLAELNMYGVKFTGKNKSRPLYSAKEFIEEIQIMKLTVTALNITQNPNGIEIDHVFHDIFDKNMYGDFNKIAPDFPDFISFCKQHKLRNIKFPIDSHSSKLQAINLYKEDKITFFEMLVEFFFGTKMKKIYPSFEYRNSKFDVRYFYSSLLSLMYYMLAYYTASGKTPIKCQSRTCNNYFIPSRKGQVNCSEICKNRVKQQRLRDKKKAHTQDVIV